MPAQKDDLAIFESPEFADASQAIEKIQPIMEALPLPSRGSVIESLIVEFLADCEEDAEHELGNSDEILGFLFRGVAETLFLSEFEKRKYQERQEQKS